MLQSNARRQWRKVFQIIAFRKIYIIQMLQRSKWCKIDACNTITDPYMLKECARSQWFQIDCVIHSWSNNNGTLRLDGHLVCIPKKQSSNRLSTMKTFYTAIGRCQKYTMFQSLLYIVGYQADKINNKRNISENPRKSFRV